MSTEKTMDEKQSRRRRKTKPDVEEVETGNFITRPLYRAGTFLQDVRSELGKVTWPTRQETFDLTRIVLVTTILSAITLGIIAALFTELIRLGLEVPAVLIVVVVLAVAAAVYYIRASNRTSGY